MEMLEELLKMTVDPASFKPADFLSLQWSSTLIFESGFNAVDLSYLQEDPGGDFWVVSFGFDELTPDVSKTADGGDFKVIVALSKGAVSA